MGIVARNLHNAAVVVISLIVAGAVIIAVMYVLMVRGSTEMNVIAQPDVDVGAWRRELVAAGASADVDMTQVYRLTAIACDSPPDSLVVAFSIPDSHPEWMRIGMRYVCPSRVSKVDDALTELAHIQQR